MTTTGFTFGKYRGKAGKELKDRFVSTGEIFDIIGVEQDMSATGDPIWRVYVRFGDGEKGMIFFGMDESARSEALSELASAIDNADIAVQPAVLRQVRTKAGRDYYYLDDPS